MRYVILLTSDTPPGPPPPALMQALMALGQEAAQAGVLVDNARLAPSAAGGVRVTLSGGEISTSDGPFADSREFLSYAVYELAKPEEAVDWASRFLGLYRDLWPQWQGVAEIRQVAVPPPA